MADLLIAARSTGLSGSVAVPGDKSISHRALILAGLAEGTSRITGLSDGEDVERTRRAIQAFGAETARSGDALTVRGATWRSPPGMIDCGNAGTAARLLLGAAAGQRVSACFDGDSSLRRRPMARLAEPLRAMGAQLSGGATLPLSVAAGDLHGIRYVNEIGSAQLKAALLLAALGATGRTEVIEPRPSRDHLELMLPAFGIPVERTEAGAAVTGPIRPRGADVRVPGDFSSAAFPLVAALIVPVSEITLTGVGLNSLRCGLLETLAEMGADVELIRRDGAEPVGDIIARASSLRGVTVPAERAPRMIDEYPILAIAAACAQGKTVMHGVNELRHKESDRIAALIEGLHRCGVAARATGDVLIVRGGRVPGGATIDSHDDHRIAMAFLVLGLVSEAPITVTDAQMIATSFPGFAATMRSLGADIA